MLALKSVLPSLPVIAGLRPTISPPSTCPCPPIGSGAGSAPPLCCRDNDAAGLKAAERLHERGLAAGIEIRELVPVYGDFNLDLCRLGPEGMRAHLADQLVPSDRTRFLPDISRSDPWR